MLSPANGTTHQARTFQHAQMPRYGWQGYRKWARELQNIHPTFRQFGKHLSANRVCERRESLIEFGHRIVNQLVNYKGREAACQDGWGNENATDLEIDWVLRLNWRCKG